jgi:lysozyme
MRATAATAPSGATASLSYNEGALTSGTSVSYDDGGTNKTVETSSQHDGWGRVIVSVNEQDGKVNTSYDVMGRVVSRTNPYPSGGQPGPSTTYEYDALGRTIEVTLPDGDEITYTYDGNKETVTDQVNRKTKRESDGLGRLVKVTEQDVTGALTQETTYSYDLLDNLTEVNQGGQLRKYKYDALGRLLYEKIPEQTATISDGAGGMWTTKYVYNDFNAVTSKTDARGVITSYSYDSLHRLSQKSYNTSGATGVAATPSVHYFYDSEGLLWLIRIGELGNPDLYEETYSYDSFNRLQSVARTFKAQTTSALTYTSSYEYNQAGQLKQLTYPSNREIDVSYNNQGKPLSLVDNGLGVNYLTQASYNHAGQLTGWNLNGVTEAYTYGNNRMQLTRQTATKSGVTLLDLNYSYQASAGQMGAGSTVGNAGQLMSITNSTIGGATESASYTYDLQGRLVTSNQTTNGASAERRFAYDRWGNRTGVWDQTTGGNQIQSVALEQSGGTPTNRILNVMNPGQPTSYHHPDQVSTSATIPINRTGRYVRIHLAVENYLSPAEVEVLTPGGTNLAVGKTATQSSTAFGGVASRGVDGNEDGVYANGSVTHTAYEDQPYWEVDLGSVETIGSIKVWNRKDCCAERLTNFYVFVSNTPFSTTDLATMLSQSEDVFEYSYDEAGNVIDDGVHTYQYDAENRVVGMDIGKSNAYTYAYNHQNRRLKSESSATGTWTNYVWEGTQVIAEYNQTGTLLTEYIYAGSRMIAKRASGTVRYFLSDKLSVRASVDSSGNVVGRQGHLPFGEEIGTSGELDKHKFTSYERDSESGLDYAVNRSHSPVLGRFVQADPYRNSGGVEDPQSWNRYSYSRNDPINLVDPMGLLEQPPGGGGTESVPYETGCQMFPELCFPYVRPPFSGGSQAPPPPPDCNPIVEVAQLPGQMSLSNNGFQFIRSFEAYRRHLYNDAAGNCTIGYGHLLHLGPCNNADRAQYPNGISRQDAEILLRSDVAIFESVVNNSVTVPLMQNQFDALVSFAFNVGGGAFQGSTLLQLLNQGDYNAVPSELLRWNRAGGRRLRGLTRRRQAEGDMFCSHYVPGYRPRI